MPGYLTKIGPPGLFVNGVQTNSNNGDFYAFPNRAEYEESVEGRSLSADTPLRAGRHGRGSRANQRRIQASGVLQAFGANPAPVLQTLMEAFRAAHRAFDTDRGDPAWHELYLQDGGGGETAGQSRILRVSNISLSLTVRKPLNRAPWKTTYEADDPYLYSTVPIGPLPLNLDGTFTNILNPGTAWCFPVLSFTLDVSAPGAVLVTNDRNGLAFSLKPTESGTYMAFGGTDASGKAERVVRDTIHDAMGVAGGEFLEFEPYINQIRVIPSGGVNVSSADVIFVPRWE